MTPDEELLARIDRLERIVVSLIVPEDVIDNNRDPDGNVDLKSFIDGAAAMRGLR